MSDRCGACRHLTFYERAVGYRLLTWTMVQPGYFDSLPRVHIGPHLDGPDGRPIDADGGSRWYRPWYRHYPDWTDPAEVTWGARQQALTAYLRPRVIEPPMSRQIREQIDSLMPWRKFFQRWFDGIGETPEEPTLVRVVKRPPRDIYA